MWAQFDPDLGTTIGEALLTPHRSYLAEIQMLLRAGARGFAHITGGGFPDNAARPLPASLCAEIDASTWEPTPTFRRIAAAGGVSAREMYRVFNMGIGLVAVVPAARVDAALEVMPEAIVIGRVVPRGDGVAVRLLGIMEG
jgi:phosphoribosylformylglycinamidine cyclo-ligase